MRGVELRMAPSILERLGLVKRERNSAGGQEPPEMLVIADRLEGLDPDRAQFVGLLAVVLARAARADLEISDVELEMIERILRDHADLPADQAELVGSIVSRRREVFGVSSDYQATLTLGDTTSVEDRENILRCLFAVCAADDSISFVEEEEIRQIATELRLGPERYHAVRSELLGPGSSRDS
jgi:tellurite resistance protein